MFGGLFEDQIGRHRGGTSPAGTSGFETYLQSRLQRIRAAYFQTPRDTVKDFVDMLNVLHRIAAALSNACLGS